MRRKKQKKEKKKNKNKDKKKSKKKKKRKGVAAKPRRQGEGEEEGRKEKKRKKKKERMRGAAPHPGSLAGCTRARNYVSRLVCGLGRRQQDGGSEWRGERDREEVGGRGWRCVRRRPAKPEEMELAGEGLWVWYKKNGGGKKLAGWHRKERCWRSGGVGLCEEVSREDVGRSSRNGEAACWMLKNVHLAFLHLKNRSCKKSIWRLMGCLRRLVQEWKRESVGRLAPGGEILPAGRLRFAL